MSDYGKLDHWSIKAQKEGYPARSVYKLKEMDEKFGLIKKGSTGQKILDLGAAPGSWSLYILKKFNNEKSNKNDQQKFLLAVDLNDLSKEIDINNFSQLKFIKGDFTSSAVKNEIINNGPYNLIISDAAPATSGNRSLDTLRSLDLSENALTFSDAALITGGNLVIKVFQGGETEKLLKKMRTLFQTAKAFKPAACRTGSFETYFLGLGKLQNIR